MDRGAQWAYSAWSRKESDMTECLTLFTLKATVLPRGTSSPGCSQLASFDTCFLSIPISLIYRDLSRDDFNLWEGKILCGSDPAFFLLTESSFFLGGPLIHRKLSLK